LGTDPGHVGLVDGSLLLALALATGGRGIF